MARPKDTKTTKWLIHHEDWFGTYADAVAMGKHSKLPYDVEHKPEAKTYFGSYRRANYRLRTYAPKLYRGHKPRTAPFHGQSNVARLRKYHKGCLLVKIQGGSYMFLEPEVSVTRRKRKKKSARARPYSRSAQQNGIRAKRWHGYYICPICGNQYSSATNFKGHVKNNHY